MRTLWPLALLMPLAACDAGPPAEANVGGVVDDARVAQTHAQIRATWDALTLYRNDVGEHPSGESGLRLLTPQGRQSSRRWRGPYLPRVPTDAWGRELLLVQEEDSLAVVSVGPDGQSGTDDDIVDRRPWEAMP